MEEIETWGSIPGYKGFEASIFGRIRSIDRVVDFCWKGKFLSRKFKGKYLKGSIDSDGYLVCGIKNASKKIHRLVAITFIENSNNYPQINHKDGNKQNNHVYNLEWCTPRENTNHLIENRLRPSKNPVINKLSGEIYYYSIDAYRAGNFAFSLHYFRLMLSGYYKNKTGFIILTAEEFDQCKKSGVNIL